MKTIMCIILVLSPMVAFALEKEDWGIIDLSGIGAAREESKRRQAARAEAYGNMQKANRCKEYINGRNDPKYIANQKEYVGRDWEEIRQRQCDESGIEY